MGESLSMCRNCYNHPPKFWPASISEPHLKSFTWWLHTPGFTSWARVNLYIHLACLLHSSLCMLMSKSCLRLCSGYAQSLRFVCVCFVHHEASVAFTHGVTFTVAQVSPWSWMINHECHTCRLYCWSVMLNMCIWMVQLFHHQVMRVCVRMITYAYFYCSHT